MVVDAYPGPVRVDLTVKPNSSIDQLTQTALAAGTGPDLVATAGPAQVAAYAAAGYLLPLEPYAQKYGWDKNLAPGHWPPALSTVACWPYRQLRDHDHAVHPATLRAHGWTPPQDRGAFEAICTEAKAKGLIPVAAGNATGGPPPSGGSPWRSITTPVPTRSTRPCKVDSPGPIPYSSTRSPCSASTTGPAGGRQRGGLLHQQLPPAVREARAATPFHDHRELGAERDPRLLRHAGGQRRHLGLGAVVPAARRRARPRVGPRHRLDTVDQRPLPIPDATADYLNFQVSDPDARPGASRRLACNPHRST